MKKTLFIKNYISDEYLFNIQQGIITDKYFTHKHDFFELIVVTSGNAIHMVNDIEYPIEAGHTFIIKPEMEHGFKNVEHLTFYNVMFDFNQMLLCNSNLRKLSGFHALFLLEPFYRKEHCFKSKLQLPKDKLLIAQQLLENIETEYQLRKDGFQVIIQAYFSTLAVFISREYKDNYCFLSEKLLQIADAITHIEQHYLDAIKLGELSDKAHLSQRQFTRIFKEIYGLSPIDYLIQLRLEHAQALLKTSTFTITQIASESGFSDPNYFSRVFSCRFGITPSEYKRL